MPPLWSLELVKTPKCSTLEESELPIELHHLMDSSEQVEALRVKNTSLSTGQLFKPVTEQIQDELHLHYQEYCHSNEVDFLISYQLRKLLNCVEIFYMTLTGKGQGIF